MSRVMKTGYIQSLTPMRGVAAIWVMFFHIDVIIFYRGFGALMPRDVSGILSKGYLWVDFFFLLSGLIISHVYGETLTKNFGKLKDIRSYLWARFTRIYPLHIFTLLVLIPFVIVFPKVSPEVVDGSWQTYFAWSAWFDNLFLINAMNQHSYLSWNIVSWSIGAEWWTYLAACLIIPFVFKRDWKRILCLTIISIFVLSMMLYWRGNLDITFDYGWLRCLAEFSIGTSLYHLYMKQIGKDWLSRDWIFIVLILIVAFDFHFRWNDGWIIPAFGLLILATAFNTEKVRALLQTSVFTYLGNISYSIYLMHGVWFMVFWFCLPYLKSMYGIHTLSIWMKILFSILFVGLTLVSAHFTYYFVEIKSRVWLRNVTLGVEKPNE